jgi:hypothetical protein
MESLLSLTFPYTQKLSSTPKDDESRIIFYFGSGRKRFLGEEMLQNTLTTSQFFHLNFQHVYNILPIYILKSTAALIRNMCNIFMVKHDA